MDGKIVVSSFLHVKKVLQMSQMHIIIIILSPQLRISRSPLSLKSELSTNISSLSLSLSSLNHIFSVDSQIYILKFTSPWI
jgi:hypothetical protein